MIYLIAYLLTAPFVFWIYELTRRMYENNQA
jgi:hypothetical protein